MIVDDSGHQLFAASLGIVFLTLLRLLHVIPNYWGAMFSIYVFLGSFFVELVNYYIPLSSWHVNIYAASVIAVILSTLAVFALYSTLTSYFPLVAILASVVMVCYAGASGNNWFNGWFPDDSNIALGVFITVIILIGVLVWIIYEWTLKWEFFQYVVMTCLIIFGCSLCTDVFYELILHRSDALDILNFDLAYLIGLIITMLIYFGIEILGNKYLPPPPKYCCCICCSTKKKRNKDKDNSNNKKQKSQHDSEDEDEDEDEDGEDYTYGIVPTEEETETISYEEKPLKKEEAFDLLDTY
jgi:hypothetical protein